MAVPLQNSSRRRWLVCVCVCVWGGGVHSADSTCVCVSGGGGGGGGEGGGFMFVGAHMRNNVASHNGLLIIDFYFFHPKKPCVHH